MTKKMLICGLLSFFLLVTVLVGCGGGNNSPNPISDITGGLVLYYPLNDDTVDAAGDHDGVVTGSLNFTADRFGNSNKACSFDEETVNFTNFIDIPSFSLAPSTSFTVSLWIKTSSSTTNPIYGSLFYFHQDGTTFSFGVNPDVSPLVIDHSVSLNTWTHIVGTYNDGNKKGAFYMNGALANSGTKTVIVSSWSINGLQLGVSWPGVIDDFRIYNRALTAVEVNQLYQYHNN